jgi:L-asparaginase
MGKVVIVPQIPPALTAGKSPGSKDRGGQESDAMGRPKDPNSVIGDSEGKMLSGLSDAPIIILHGGAGPQDTRLGGLAEANRLLQEFIKVGMERLLHGEKALEVMVALIMMMEDAERFNAGRGSAIQWDGATRLTASIMDGKRQRFSAAVNATFTNHPILIAKELQDHKSTVLTQPGTELIARQLNLPIEKSLTEKRLKKFVESGCAVSQTCDTVGCVIKCQEGRLWAATSTGGRGCEIPGRMSDSATVAGNYATEFLAVSATGQGEQIVDDAVAARMEARCRDGLTLKVASEKAFREAEARQSRYGWIAIDKEGHWSTAFTTEAMSFAVMAGDELVAHS